jgi:hypothetical protein
MELGMRILAQPDQAPIQEFSEFKTEFRIRTSESEDGIESDATEIRDSDSWPWQSRT